MATGEPLYLSSFCVVNVLSVVFGLWCVDGWLARAVTCDCQITSVDESEVWAGLSFAGHSKV